MIQHLTEIVDEARKRGKKRLAVAYGQDSHTLEAVYEAYWKSWWKFRKATCQKVYCKQKTPGLCASAFFNIMQVSHTVFFLLPKLPFPPCITTNSLFSSSSLRSSFRTFSFPNYLSTHWGILRKCRLRWPLVCVRFRRSHLCKLCKEHLPAEILLGRITEQQPLWSQYDRFYLPVCPGTFCGYRSH